MIEQFAPVRLRQISVGKSWGNIESVTVVFGQFESEPRSARRRPRPDVDNHVENRSMQTLHELCLAMGLRLPMEAADRIAVSIKGKTPLGKVGDKTGGMEKLPIEYPGEKATLVRQTLWNQQLDARQTLRFELHRLDLRSDHAHAQ